MRAASITAMAMAPAPEARPSTPNTRTVPNAFLAKFAIGPCGNNNLGKNLTPMSLTIFVYLLEFPITGCPSIDFLIGIPPAATSSVVPVRP